MPEMTKEWQEENQRLKAKWFFGHAQAIDFINRLFFCVEIYDDLIDKDQPVTDKQINTVFRALMFDLPCNDWFIANRMYYLPLINTCLNAFEDSNTLCDSDDKKLRNLAFHIRNMGIELHIATAYLLGGYEHMREVSAEIREFFAFESFEDWEKENG